MSLSTALGEWDFDVATVTYREVPECVQDVQLRWGETAEAAVLWALDETTSNEGRDSPEFEVHMGTVDNQLQGVAFFVEGGAEEQKNKKKRLDRNQAEKKELDLSSGGLVLTNGATPFVEKTAGLFWPIFPETWISQFGRFFSISRTGQKVSRIARWGAGFWHHPEYWHFLARINRPFALVFKSSRRRGKSRYADHVS